MQDDSQEKVKATLAADFTRYAGLGLQFAATAGVLGGLGLWADRKLGTSPWLVLVGVTAGFVGGTYAILRAVPAPRASKLRAPTSPEDPPRP